MRGPHGVVKYLNLGEVLAVLCASFLAVLIAPEVRASAVHAIVARDSMETLHFLLID